MRNFSFLLLIFLFSNHTSEAQSGISGRVLTSDRQRAEYVNVQLNKGEISTVTDQHGKFIFEKLKPGNYQILVSFTGLQSQFRDVVVEEGKYAVVEFILSENATQLSEVVVSAKLHANTQILDIGKAGICAMDLPQSIAIINQAVLKEQQAQRLSDVIKNVNGVYLGTTRGSVQETFYARGYSFSSGNMFRNGSRVNSAVMPEISSLERVEVLKGSAALLFGNVAPGGIINMVTKQPRFENGGELSFRSGSYGLYKPAIDLYGPISKNVAYRLNACYEKSNSFRDVVHSKRAYINPSFLFKLGSKTDLIIQGDHLSTNFTPDFGIGTIDNTIIPQLGRSVFLGTSWQYNKASQTTANITVKHSINKDWSLSANSSFQRYTRDYYSTERIQAAANGDWTRPLNKILSREDYYIAGADLKGNFNTGKITHRLLTGFDADHYSTINFGFNNPVTYDKINILDPGKYTARTDIPAASKITKVQTPVNRFGIYVQDLISLNSKIKLLAGLRWSEQVSRPATTKYLLRDSLSFGKRKTDAAFSPRGGLVYQPNAKTTIFASYANSFTVNNGTDVFGNALNASIIDQYEFGTKNVFLNGKLTLNLTIYRILNNNLAQTAQFAADGVTVNTNTALKELTGQTTSDGFEADITADPVQGLSIIAGYSYNNLRYTKTEQKTGNYIEGQRLVNTPAQTANSSIFYRFSKGKLKGFNAGTTVVYIGNRYGGYNNTYGQTQNFSRLIPVKGFVTADVSAGYNWKKFSVMAKVSNVLNEFNYYVHENYSINPIAPRQYVATLSYKL